MGFKNLGNAERKKCVKATKTPTSPLVRIKKFNNTEQLCRHGEAQHLVSQNRSPENSLGDLGLVSAPNSVA